MSDARAKYPDKFPTVNALSAKLRTMPIELNVDTVKLVKGSPCYTAAYIMQTMYPELEIVSGTVSYGDKSSGHVWNVAPDGTIIDATVSQDWKIDSLTYRREASIDDFLSDID